MAALPEGKPRERRLVELNVVESCLNLFKTPTVQKKRVDTYMNADYAFTTPRIHALVFDPSVNASPPPSLSLSGSARLLRQKNRCKKRCPAKCRVFFLERRARRSRTSFASPEQPRRVVSSVPLRCVPRVSNQVGKLARLHVNFQSLLGEYSGIYDVYGKRATTPVVRVGAFPAAKC